MSKLDGRLDQDTRLDIVEAKEAVERALDRLNTDLPGSARSHMRHAIVALERILGRMRDEETGPPPKGYQETDPWER